MLVQRPVDIDDGTMCRTKTCTPGPVVGSLYLLTYTRLADWDVYERVVWRALDALLYGKRVVHLTAGLLDCLIHDLVLTLKRLIAAIASAARTGKQDILASLGLNFLQDSIDGFDEVMCLLPRDGSRHSHWP